MTGHKSRRERGAAAVEMAIVMPLLLLFVAGIIDLGRLLYVQTMVTNAAREGARMVALGYTNADATVRVQNASPGLSSSTFGGPLAITYVNCPASPGPSSAATARVQTTNFNWLILDVAFNLFGGSGTAPQPNAEASMRCLG